MRRALALALVVLLALAGAFGADNRLSQRQDTVLSATLGAWVAAPSPRLPDPGPGVLPAAPAAAARPVAHRLARHRLQRPLLPSRRPARPRARAPPAAA